MNTVDFEQTLLNVCQRFADPSHIVESDAFDREQKIALLRQWEQDLRLMLVASEESMTGPGQSGEDLKKVREALDRLNAAESLDATAPNKSGGGTA